jgi:hypothetical protein
VRDGDASAAGGRLFQAAFRRGFQTRDGEMAMARMLDDLADH